MVILLAAPGYFARRQYFDALDIVYPGGSCGTCHVRESGGGPRNSYGTLFENQPNHATDHVAALRSVGAPTTATPTSTVTTTRTPKSPGFGIVVSIVGLSVCALLKKRNK